MELRKWLRERMMGNMRKGITIEEIAGECETDFSCRMVTASRSENELGWRMGPALRWSDWSTGARRPSHEEAGNNKHFV